MEKAGMTIEEKLSQISARLAESSEILRNATEAISRTIVEVQCEIEEIYVALGDMDEK